MKGEIAMNDSIKEYRSRLTKNGLITLLTALLLVVVLVLANVLVSSLPANKKKIDMTSNKMYSVTQDTQREIARVDHKIAIYLIASGGEAALADEGYQLNTFLANAAAVNKKITYSVIDPLTQTEWLESSDFAGESLGNLSVIVQSDLRYRHIPFSDLFSYYIDQVGKINQSDIFYYYYYYQLEPYYVFDGETMLLGALSYVTNENVPTVYTITTHSETALSNTVLSQLDAANIDTKTLTLESAIPDDCSLLIINAPQTDYSSDELAVLSEYITNGGCVFLTTTPDTNRFVNLCTFAESMGLVAESGIVVEQNGEYYYSASSNAYPYYLLPQNGSHSILEGTAPVMIPLAHGIDCSKGSSAGMTVTPLFSTSASAYLVPTDAANAEKPEGAEERSFCVGAVAENKNGGQFIWIASYQFLNDTINQAVAGGNYAFLAHLANRQGLSQEQAPTADLLPMITPKLTVEAAAAGALAILLIIILPIVIIVAGALYRLRRKRR